MNRPDSSRCLDGLLEERERLIEEVRTRQEERLRLRRALTHDLQNPLTTISNFVGVARSDAARGATDELGRDLDVVEAAAQSMRQLLQDLVHLVDLDEPEETMEEIDFGELAEEAAMAVSDPVALRGVELEIVKDLPVVRGDRTRFLLVLVNLLENAVKFLGDEPVPWIRIGVRRRLDGRRLEAPVFFVADNGVGIEPAYHEKVFELFDRLDETIGGTGVGLSLVRRVLERYGGSAWVESEGAGCGTTICFTLGRAVLSSR